MDNANQAQLDDGQVELAIRTGNIAHLNRALAERYFAGNNISFWHMVSDSGVLHPNTWLFILQNRQHADLQFDINQRVGDDNLSVLEAAICLPNSELFTAMVSPNAQVQAIFGLDAAALRECWLIACDPDSGANDDIIPILQQRCLAALVQQQDVDVVWNSAIEDAGYNAVNVMSALRAAGRNCSNVADAIARLRVADVADDEEDVLEAFIALLEADNNNQNVMAMDEDDDDEDEHGHDHNHGHKQAYYPAA